MTPLHLIVLSTSCLLVVVSLYRTWRLRSALRRAVKQHGCEKPRRYPHQDGFLSTVLQRVRNEASQKGQLNKLYEEHFRTHGKTFEEQSGRTKMINTMETANIQQVAGLRLQDWEVGTLRQPTTVAFTGHGIFSRDGTA